MAPPSLFKKEEPQSPPPAKPAAAAATSSVVKSQQVNAPATASMLAKPTTQSQSFPPPEVGFPDPYRILGDSRKVLIFKELTGRTKFVNCMLGFCGVTRYRYYVRDAISGRELFKAKLSYSTSCNTCSGTRHVYTLELYCLPLDGSRVLGKDSQRGLFMATSSSPNTSFATGGHGVMDMRNKETIGRVIPSPTGSITIKDGSQSIAFRIGLPVSAGYGNTTSEMLIEDSSTTALVGRIVKSWGKSDNECNLCCCCGPSNSSQYGNFMLDMSAVSNVKKRALLIMSGIISDAAAFSFRAAPPIAVPSGGQGSIESADEADEDTRKPLVGGK
jgi:hypothetical protein